MSAAKNLQESIHEANVTVHRFEAKYYELLHPEVYSKQEQKRIISTLKTADKLVSDNHKKALDFGAGTGNLTGKLLSLGYKVTAIDISAEMCAILKNRYKTYIEDKKLIVINSPIEAVSFDNSRIRFNSLLFGSSSSARLCRYTSEAFWVLKKRRRHVH